MGKVIAVEGYRAFTGTMAIQIVTFTFPVIGGKRTLISGDWLYRPDTDCWYCKGQSYPSSICTIWRVQ